MSYCKIQEIAISPVRSKAKESEIMPPQERQVFEAYLNQLDSPFAVGIKLCMYTGLRIGEISGLRWEDIDFEKELMHISRTVLRIEDTSPEGEKKTKLVIASPKTKTSDRQIPIPHFMIRELKKWRMREGTYVLNGKPAPMEPRLIQYHFHKYLEKCSLKQYNFHSIRHGFATMCIEKGFDMKSLSEILGHSTVSTTMNIYLHSSLEQKKIQMNKLGV